MTGPRPAPDPEPRDAELPRPLIDALRALERTPAVPPIVEAAILRSGRERAREIRERRSTWRWAAAVAAAAAAVVLLWSPPLGDGPEPRAAIAEDIDRSGRVDILDAFALARALRDGAGDVASADFNGDGRVDADDVDHVARVAVR